MNKQQISVNLPVKNREAGRTFFAALAFEDLDGHIWELAYMESSAPSEGQ